MLQVDEEHLAGLKPPLADYALLGDIEDTHLGGHDYQVVIGDQITGRPKTITVQGGADLATIGESYRRRSIPGLHECGVIFVKGAALLVHHRVAGPGLRDQDHHGVGQGITAHHQQLQRVVEAGRVGLTLRDQGPDLIQIRANDLRCHVVTAGRHPVEVAPQGIDLAIVGDHAEGVGQVPGREGIGGEALVDQCQGRLEEGVVEVLVIAAYLIRQEHTLVNQGAGGQGGHIKAGLGQTGEADGVVHALARHKEAALEGILVAVFFPSRDEDLADHGFRRQDARAQDAAVHRHLAPAQNPVATLGDLAIYN